MFGYFVSAVALIAFGVFVYRKVVAARAAREYRAANPPPARPRLEPREPRDLR